MKLAASSNPIAFVMYSTVPTNKFEHEWFESSGDFWSICSSGDVDVDVTWMAAGQTQGFC